MSSARRSSTAAPVAEVRGVGVACEHLVGLRAQDVDVALSPTLGHELPARAKRRAQAPEQPVVVGDPVEGRRREDRVDGLLEVELEQIAHAHIHAGPSRRRAAATIDADASTAMTRPPGRRSSSAWVIRPEPQPASSTVSSPSS